MLLHTFEKEEREDLHECQRMESLLGKYADQLRDMRIQLIKEQPMVHFLPLCDESAGKANIVRHGCRELLEDVHKLAYVLELVLARTEQKPREE